MANYRLITLLNIDYKILTRILISRIVSIIENFIGLRQTRFLPGRQMRDNVILVNLIIHLTKIEKKNDYAIFIDIQKVYNRVVYN